jgi:hypothetical protein
MTEVSISEAPTPPKIIRPRIILDRIGKSRHHPGK